MADPILTVTAIALASGAAGGAAGKLVERGVDAGVDWIRAHLSKHGHAIQERAERNAAEFLIELATRVSRIEKELAALMPMEPLSLSGLAAQISPLRCRPPLLRRPELLIQTGTSS